VLLNRGNANLLMNLHIDKSEENHDKLHSSYMSQAESSQVLLSPDYNRPKDIVQRKLQENADESLIVNRTSQLQAIADNFAQHNNLIQRKENNTGLPDKLKSGIENLSGISMDDVKVHRNSDKPAQLNAHAYAQGNEIHLGSGQEKHLPHEAWHVVQQKQNRVKPTTELPSGEKINDNNSLESEATSLGNKALSKSIFLDKPLQRKSVLNNLNVSQFIIQREPEVGVEEAPKFGVTTAHMDGYVDPTQIQKNRKLSADTESQKTNGVIDIAKNVNETTGEAANMGGQILDGPLATGVERTDSNDAGAEQSVGDLDSSAKLLSSFTQFFKFMKTAQKTNEDRDSVGFANTSIQGIKFIHSVVESVFAFIKTGGGAVKEIGGLMPGIKSGANLIESGLEIFKDNKFKKVLDKVKERSKDLDLKDDGKLDNDLEEITSRISYKLIEDSSQMAWSIAELVSLAFPGLTAGVTLVHSGFDLLKSGVKMYINYGKGKRAKAAARLNDGEEFSEVDKKEAGKVSQVIDVLGNGKFIDFTTILKLQQQWIDKNHECANFPDDVDENVKTKAEQEKEEAKGLFERKLILINKLLPPDNKVTESTITFARKKFLKLVKTLKDDVEDATNSTYKKLVHFLSMGRLQSKISAEEVFHKAFEVTTTGAQEDLKILTAFQQYDGAGYLDVKLKASLDRAIKFKNTDRSNKVLQDRTIDEISPHHSQFLDLFMGLDKDIFKPPIVTENITTNADGETQKSFSTTDALFKEGLEKYFNKVNPLT